MSAITMRLNGLTTRLTLTASASAATAITPNTNVQNNYVALLNTGAGLAAIEFSQTSTVATPAIPASGSSGSLVLPPNMQLPMLVACPANTFYIKAIGDASGSILLITPALSE
jgi:hypothetical protein